MTEQTAEPTVQKAWAAVMADVQGLGKGQRNNAPGANYNFRGIDDVMNAVGPVLRRHGVSVVPTTADAAMRDVTTAKGKPSREASVSVTYTIYGPAGDSMPGGSVGEAMDVGDKATPKAMSVAYRTFLLQALCLPTNEVDPDAETYERGAEQAPAETPIQMARRGIAQAATVESLEQVLGWAQSNGLADAVAREAANRRAELAGGEAA